MKPQPIAPSYNSLPAELTQLPIWLLWKYQLVEGRWTKVPYIADHGAGTAKTNDPSTWRSFDHALKFAPRASGIGLVFTETEYCGFDLDACRDPETGVIAAWARLLLDRLDTYTEVSPSGTGVHPVLRLTRPLPPGDRKHGGKDKGWEIGIYDRTSPRYFCATGVVLDGYNKRIRTCDPDEFYPAFLAGEFDPEPTKPKANGNGAVNGNGNGHRVITGDDKRTRLQSGLWQDLYKSQSEADSALVWYLADEFDNDPVLIDQAFRQSALMRPKWDKKLGRETYGSRTIARVLAKKKSESTGFEAPQSSNGRGWKKLLLCPMTEDGPGTPLPVLANAVTALRHAQEWSGVLAYNSFAHRIETQAKTPWGKPVGTEWTDVDDGLTCTWLQHEWIVIKSSKTAGEAANIVAQENSFNPLQDYLESLDWDGVPRLERWLITYLGVDDSAYARAVGTCWMISAVARAFQPGCQADYMLILEGPQGLLKSSTIRLLAGREWFTDHIAVLGSKDSRLDLQGRWIVEFSEMDKVRGQVLETVKAFITCREDKFRMPYGRRAEVHPRTCVLIGTCNGSAHLTDETGARRFWPVECGHVDMTLLSEHRDQLWAEAVHRYQSGARWYLETAELNALAAEEQEKRYVPGVWDDVILKWIDDPKQSYRSDGGSQLPVEPFNSTRDRVTVTDILLHAIGMPMDRHNAHAQSSVAKCLRHEGWKMKQDWSKTETRGLRFYYRPEKATERLH